MKSQRFGIEIELIGITRKVAADIVAAYFGTSAVYDGTYYDTYATIDSQGRKGKFMSDASITPQRKSGRQTVSASAEFYQHHGSQGGLDIQSATGFSSQTAPLVQAGGHRFLEELNCRKPRTLDQVSLIWYNGESRSNFHYDDSRYHCLNLHSVFQKGTVEFRLFNGTTHAGKIKAYIQLCMAISAQALNQRCASQTKTQTTNEKYTFRTWLLCLGLIGDEFKTAREHLLKNPDGCIAWRDPAQAEKQKERMRHKKEKELEQARQESQPTAPELTEAEAEDAPAFTICM